MAWCVEAVTLAFMSSLLIPSQWECSRLRLSLKHLVAMKMSCGEFINPLAFAFFHEHLEQACYDDTYNSRMGK